MKERYKDLYQIKREKMFAIAYGILKNYHDAEDAVEEVFYAILKLERDLSNFNDEQIDRYLISAVRNKAFDMLDTRRNESKYKKSVIVKRYTENVEYKRICAEEREKYVIEKMDELPETYKIPMKKYVLDDMTVNEIAEETNDKKDSVRKRVQRGRKILEMNMKDYKEYF